MAIDWTNIFNKYKGLWVALKDDERTVVASGKTVKETLKKAQKEGFLSPIITRMPKDLTFQIGYQYEVLL